MGILIALFSALIKISDISVFSGILTGMANLSHWELCLLIDFKKAKRKFNAVFKFNRVSPLLWMGIMLLIHGVKKAKTGATYIPEIKLSWS
jgi:hypothetical protein